MAQNQDDDGKMINATVRMLRKDWELLQEQATKCGLKNRTKLLVALARGGGSSGQENINRGQGTTGKVLGQLRELKQAHLNFIDACTGTLQEHRNLFEENMDSLEKEIIEAIGWEEE